MALAHTGRRLLKAIELTRSSAEGLQACALTDASRYVRTPDAQRSFAAASLLPADVPGCSPAGRSHTDACRRLHSTPRCAMVASGRRLLDQQQQQVGDPEVAAELKTDWFFRVFRLAVVGSLLASFYCFTPTGLYGPLSSQLLLLRAEESFLRSTALQRMRACAAEARVNEMRAAGGFTALVSVIAGDVDAAVRRDALAAAKAWAHFHEGRLSLVDVDAVAVLQTVLAHDEDEGVKEQAEELIIDLLNIQ